MAKLDKREIVPMASESKLWLWSKEIEINTSIQTIFSLNMLSSSSTGYSMSISFNEIATGLVSELELWQV